MRIKLLQKKILRRCAPQNDNAPFFNSLLTDGASSFLGRGAENGPPEFAETIARLGGFFELEVARIVEHLFFQPSDLSGELLFGHRFVARLFLGGFQLQLHVLEVAAPSIMSCTCLEMPIGVMPRWVLNSTCFARRRSVSPIARFIESVTLSA